MSMELPQKSEKVDMKDRENQVHFDKEGLSYVNQETDVHTWVQKGSCGFAYIEGF